MYQTTQYFGPISLSEDYTGNPGQPVPVVTMGKGEVVVNFIVLERVTSKSTKLDLKHENQTHHDR